MVYYRDEEKLKERALLNDLVNKNKSAENEWEENNSELITEEKYIFKAKPVPNHVKKNLLKKMMEEHPQRFKFGANLEQNNNNNNNKLKRTQSVPILNLNDEGQFKAKPFPKSIFTDFAYEQIREDHRYRTIRKEMRQKALLNSAKLPPRMQEVRDKMSKESENKVGTIFYFVPNHECIVTMGWNMYK